MKKEATIAKERLKSIPEATIMYDEYVKATLALKVFLARILQATMKEFKNVSVKIVETSIEGEIFISKIAVNPGLTNAPRKEVITESVNEDSIINEGTITFDIHTYVRLPNKEMTKVIINVEAQKDSYPGYDLETRAIFYCARLLSSQLGKEFSNKQTDPKKYANIKKVYSIWIVMSPPQYLSDSIVCYQITPSVIYKNPLVERKNIQHEPYYDLMAAVMVFMPYKYGVDADESVPESGNKLIKLLTTLLGKRSTEERLQKLEDDFDIQLTTDVRKVVNDMCNLGEGLIEEGIQQGKIQTTIESIKSLMRKMEWTANQAMEALEIPNTDFPKYMALL